MKHILVFACIVDLALAQFTARDSAVRAETPDAEVPVAKEIPEVRNWFAPRDWLNELKQLPLDSYLDLGLLDKGLTEEERDRTAVSKLSPREKAALEKWLHKYVSHPLTRVKPPATLRRCYHFHLETAPEMLTEDLAVEMARTTLRADGRAGYMQPEWQLSEADKPYTRARDGTPEEHFRRFNYRPGAGSVHFTDGTQHCAVQVCLEGNWVVCERVPRRDPSVKAEVVECEVAEINEVPVAREIPRDELAALQQIPIDMFLGLYVGLLDKAMTEQEQDSTGVSRLSASERAALEASFERLRYVSAHLGVGIKRRATPPRDEYDYDQRIHTYVYRLPEPPPGLTEALAIEVARTTFARMGYEPEQWQLTTADRSGSMAPDGTPDKYFDRFSYRPTEGRVHFTDGDQYRTVQVRLEDDQVVCEMFYGL